MFEEVLGLAGLGIDDDFFELGGHSLLAMQVLSRVTAGSGSRLSLRDVLEAPTIRALSELLAVLESLRQSPEETATASEAMMEEGLL